MADQNRDYDDAEKGLYDNTKNTIVIPSHVHIEYSTLRDVEALKSPISLIHEGITPSSSVPMLTLPPSTLKGPMNTTVSDTNIEKPAPPKKEKKKISRWVLFQLWFNMYRKFFTFVVLLNLAGLIMAALDRFDYAKNHIGALVLGNLLFAVLMRNELFLRVLYMVAIYGLRSVRLWFKSLNCY